MFLNSLSLTNFRNYSKASFDFSPETTLVVGPNTSGKTNLLEAIYFLATGKPFRATSDREAIRRGEALCHLRGVISRRDGAPHLRGERLALQVLASENGPNVSSKQFKVNGVKKRLSDFAGNLRAVYFGPEEILLVTGSPSRRRKYLDSVLVQVDREYARALLEYEKVLRQRNRLLLLIREGEQDRSQLDFWDEKLMSLGSTLSSKRQKMLRSFNRRLEEVSRLMLLFEPRPWVKEKELREREIAAGMTLHGPHRDDFRFIKKGSENSENGPEQLRKLSQSERQSAREPDKSDSPEVRNSGASDTLIHRGTDALSYSEPPSHSEFSDLSSYGSRGEQRLAVLHLKLAELEFITERVGDRPILLLDDIFSELDEENRGQVLSLLGKQQTIVTATDLDQIDGEELRQHDWVIKTLKH